MIEIIDYRKKNASEVELTYVLKKIEADVMQACGLTQEELFWHQIDAGENYLKGRVTVEFYKDLIADKGFWHWYRQVWCRCARWLIEENQPLPSIGCLSFKNFNKYLRAKADAYSFEPVLISMSHRRQYDGRIIW